MKCLELTKGYVAIVSNLDWSRVSQYSWHVHFSKGKGKKRGQPYARATVNGKKVYLHRWLLDARKPMHVDHKNTQTLDCRRSNLEIVTHKENQRRRCLLPEFTGATT